MPTAINSNGINIQLSEFTFSYQGNLLNLNNRDQSSVNIISVSASSAGQDANGTEGPMKVVDGSLATKWYRGNATVAGNGLIFDFGETPPTIDAYNFATANDSTSYARTPISWTLAGSHDSFTWVPLDARDNFPVVIQNNTYQAGFSIPNAIPPTIEYFRAYNTGTAGNASIVLNSSSPALSWVSADASLGVTLTEAGGAAVSVPDVASEGYTISPPPNSTVAYTLTATGNSDEPATRTTTIRTVEGGAETYQYVRFKATKLRSGAATGAVQLSEFRFLAGGVSVPVANVTNPGGSNGAEGSTSTERAIFLIDGNTATKWYDGNNAPVIFDFGSPQTFDHYSFSTANDAVTRDPIRWTLEGSNDNATWTVIEHVNFDYPTPTDRFFSSLDIPLPGVSIAPLIRSFAGDSGDVIIGQSVVLSYDVQAAATITLNGEPVTGPTGSITVTPTAESTTYTIAAEGAYPGNGSSATFTITTYTDPGVDTIDFADFSTTGNEIRLFGNASFTNDRLRITPELQGQSGAAWFYKKLNGTSGFEATFSLSLNQAVAGAYTPADGVAFVIHNAPGGASVLGNGENGVPTNALNIKFKTFGFDAESASRLEVIAGTTVLASASIYNTPGTVLAGIPAVRDAEGAIIAGNFPFTLGTIASHPPYPVRVVYTPGDLDVYFQGVAIVQNVNVYLDTIGAIDGSGNSYFGFTGRTGGNVQNNDITDWKVTFGDFSTLPPFGMVKTVNKHVAGTARPEHIDLVWNARSGFTYKVQASTDLLEWEDLDSYPGVAGQLGYAVYTLDVPAEFYRVVETE